MIVVIPSDSLGRVEILSELVLGRMMWVACGGCGGGVAGYAKVVRFDLREVPIQRSVSVRMEWADPTQSVYLVGLPVFSPAHPARRRLD